MLFKSRPTAGGETGNDSEPDSKVSAAPTRTDGDIDETPVATSVAPTGRPQTECGDDGDDDTAALDDEAVKRARQIRWSRLLTFVMVPVLALLLAATAGFFKWQAASMSASATARIQSIQAAKDTTVALLSYQPDTAEKELGAAAERLTGSFKKDYQDLIKKVVIPGAKEQHISTTATVSGAASVSATPNHAVVLVFVDQTTTVGNNPPSDLVSTVRVTMDEVNNRWLMSGFDPV